MRSNGLIGFALGIVTAASVAILVAAKATTNPVVSPVPVTSAGPVGRYQVVHVDRLSNAIECWVLDTTNGHLWFHSTLDKEYDDQGTPPDTAK